MRRPVIKAMKPGLVPGFFLAGICGLALPACDVSPAGSPGTASRPVQRAIAGQLANKNIDEASGLAWSARSDDLLWTHNDSGDKARLYAIGLAGQSRGRVKLDHADNKDWEDIASFVLDGEPYLLVADIGDNDSKRKHVSLYIVAEPDLSGDDTRTLDPAWQIDFTYPDGPRDAEAVAVDIERQRVLILSKRDLPARLYQLPLRPDTRETINAEWLHDMGSLPQPHRQDVEFAPMSKDWHWQPTAMDISRDGNALIILTYGSIYYFERHGPIDWPTALEQLPLALKLHNFPDAEAAALSPDGQTIFVTAEKKHAPLLRIDLEDRPAPGRP